MLLEPWAWVVPAVYVVWPSVYVLVAAMLPVGLAIPITDSVVIAHRIAITPDRLIGRVEAARSTLALALAPLGPLAAGLLLEASARGTVGVFAGLGLGLALTGTFRAELWRA